VLAAADCTFADVVDVTVYLVDAPSTIDAVWKVLPEYWGEAPGRR
jgi:enamine deaminase RidA (YjgF/YER057c/UK114 family)